MSDQDRIRLAKVMNIPKRRHYGVYHENMNQEFNPFTDANDCDALIRHLNGLGIFVEITHFADGTCWVQIEGPNHYPRERYEGDDYKQGVCELALKVLDNE